MFGRSTKTDETTLRLKIDGMHCTSCSLTIDDTLEELAGVQKSSTNYAKAVATVEYDPAQITPEKIIEAVQGTGYDASILAG